MTDAFRERMEGVLALYAQPYRPDEPVVCFDEKCFQLLDHTRAPHPMRPGHVRREDHEYRRCGTRNLFMLVEPLAGKRCVLLTHRRTKRDFACAVRYLLDTVYPHARCVHLVLDNLNTHRCSSLVETFGKDEADRLMARLTFHFTPPHGSWLNMAEIELSILTRQCLSRRIPNAYLLGLELIAWENDRNAALAKINWSFTLDDARRVSPLSPSSSAF